MARWKVYVAVHVEALSNLEAIDVVARLLNETISDPQPVRHKPVTGWHFTAPSTACTGLEACK